MFWSFIKYNIHWDCLSINPHPAAIHLLEANSEKIDWDQLSQNPSAIHLLEANIDKIDWRMLCYNPAAIHLLESNPEKNRLDSVISKSSCHSFA